MCFFLDEIEGRNERAVNEKLTGVFVLARSISAAFGFSFASFSKLTRQRFVRIFIIILKNVSYSLKGFPNYIH